MLGALGVAAVVVVVAEVLVRRAPRQHVVDRDEHGVRDGDHGLLVSAVAHDATVAGRQRPPSMPDGTKGRFGECGAEPPVPPPGLSGAMLRGTLVVTGAERSPAGQVPGAREDARKSDPVSLDTVWTTMTAAKEAVNASQAAEAFDSWQ